MRRLLGPTLALFVALSLSAPAIGFIQQRTPSGVGVRWDLTAIQPNISSGMVKYVVNKRGSDDVAFSALLTAVEAAFTIWRRTNSSVIDFVRLVDPSTLSNGTTANGNDQVNVLYWEEDPRNGFMIEPLTFARTFRTVDGITGRILDVDIVLNGIQFLWTTQADGNFASQAGPADIQEVMTKAVGEFIGLNVVPTMGSVLQEVDYPGNWS